MYQMYIILNDIYIGLEKHIGCAILVFAFAKYQNIKVANHMH